jgi:hypothetical protein
MPSPQPHRGPVDQSLVAELRVTRGTVATGATAAVAGFNEIAQHQPDIRVIPGSVGEIRRAVRVASERTMPVGVHSTGHGMVTPMSGGLLIDLSGRTGVSVDPIGRTATVQGGARWGSVIEAAAVHGLAPLNGSSPLVGVAGYTLGGGLGLLGRRYGYAADLVRSLELVSPTGEAAHLSPTSNADLYAAVLGGKSNFGVVTSLTFELVEVRGLYGGGLYYPAPLAEQAVRAWATWTQEQPDSMSSSLAFLRLPEVPTVPAFLAGRLVTHIRISFDGPAEEGRRLLEPLRRLGPSRDTIRLMAYRDVATIHHDPTDPMPYDERSLLLPELGPAALDDLVAAAGADAPGRDVMVELRHLGGALGRAPKHHNSVGNRDAAFSLSTITIAGTEQPDGTPLVDAMARWGTGRRYLNFLGGPSTAGQVAEAYDAGAYEALVATKSRVDPSNLFRVNHNILPTTASE